MGVDILSYSGVIASLDDMLGFISNKNCEQVKTICQNFYDKLLQESKENEDCDWRKKKVEFFEALNKVEEKTLDELKEILSSVVVVNGQPAKYDIDTHVEYEEDVLELWLGIIETHEKELPSLDRVTAFGSARYNGYDVPLGQACFVFDDNSCFEKKMSTVGKNLKKIIGHCNVTDWTVYSC